MRGADFRKEGLLNEKNIQLIYENKKVIINDLLKISNADEFLEVFDSDEVIYTNNIILIVYNLYIHMINYYIIVFRTVS